MAIKTCHWEPSDEFDVELGTFVANVVLDGRNWRDGIVPISGDNIVIETAGDAPALDLSGIEAGNVTVIRGAAKL